MKKNQFHGIENNNFDNVAMLSMIQQNFNRLTSAHQKVALYILSNPGKVLDLTAEQISKEINTSEASVVRFCKDIGFKGFHAFKIKLAKDLGANNSTPVPENISKNDTPWQIFQKVMISENEDIKLTMDMLDKESFIKAVELLGNANRIGFFAVGSSYTAAYDAYWHFSNIGKAAQVQQDPGGQLILAQSLQKGDVAFAISLTGQSKIPVMALKTAKENNVSTICLTKNPKSELTNYSDCVLVTYKKGSEMYDFATSFRLTQLAVLDAIYLATIVNKWDTATENLKKFTSIARYQQF